MKKICHIDLNCFFAQAEVIKDPSLEGKAIAVGYEGSRGVLSTCSYEARKYNIHSGMASKEAKQILPSLIIINGDYSYYKQLSSEFFSFLKKTYSLIEIASIDECYIDMTSFLDNFTKEEEEDYLRDLQLKIYKAVNLKCSIGLGDTKFLAKMASDYKKPLGITIIHKEDIKEMLFPLDVSKMYGIGKMTALKLNNNGVKNISDLYNLKNGYEILGNNFYYYIQCLEGESSSSVNVERFKNKSISSERTFLTDVCSIDEVLDMSKTCFDECYNQLKKSNGRCKTIFIKFRTLDFITHSKRYTFDDYTNNYDILFSNIETLFETSYHEENIRLIGVGLDNIIYEENIKKEERIKLF